jgi:hypothetical protein
MAVTSVKLPPHTSSLRASHAEDTRPAVLVLGVYLANKPSHVRSVVANLSSSSSYRVKQRWAAIGGTISDSLVQSVTRVYQPSPLPKFLLMNQLLELEALHAYEYVVIVDDDILLPESFLDGFLKTQSAVGFCLAQPARTPNSSIDHSIVRRVEGILARETLFVEIGPVTSFHRSIFHLVFPFDMTSPMGWGYENVWAYRLSQNGFQMGIVDAYPVDHSLRPPVIYYDRTEAKEAKQRLLAPQPHFPLTRCYTTLRTFPLSAGIEEREREKVRHLSVLGHGLRLQISFLLSKLVHRARGIRSVMWASRGQKD